MYSSVKAKIIDGNAAIYARMSTNQQEFSVENQLLLLTAYAQTHNLQIVETFIDYGKSGLTIEHRPQLSRLIETVCSGNAAFSTILVLDVSRWGRF